jgi:hypothetical protein
MGPSFSLTFEFGSAPAGLADPTLAEAGHLPRLYPGHVSKRLIRTAVDSVPRQETTTRQATAGKPRRHEYCQAHVGPSSWYVICSGACWSVGASWSTRRGNLSDGIEDVPSIPHGALEKERKACSVSVITGRLPPRGREPVHDSKRSPID